MLREQCTVAFVRRLWYRCTVTRASPTCVQPVWGNTWWWVNPGVIKSGYFNPEHLDSILINVPLTLIKTVIHFVSSASAQSAPSALIRDATSYHIVEDIHKILEFRKKKAARDQKLILNSLILPSFQTMAQKIQNEWWPPSYDQLRSKAIQSCALLQNCKKTKHPFWWEGTAPFSFLQWL